MSIKLKLTVREARDIILGKNKDWVEIENTTRVQKYPWTKYSEKWPTYCNKVFLNISTSKSYSFKYFEDDAYSIYDDRYYIIVHRSSGAEKRMKESFKKMLEEKFSWVYH